MIFGYARVSTKTQARDGNSLDAQQAALTAAGAEKIYTDTFTGTNDGPTGTGTRRAGGSCGAAMC
mgnify:CR=1 FL=1